MRGQIICNGLDLGERSCVRCKDIRPSLADMSDSIFFCPCRDVVPEPLLLVIVVADHDELLLFPLTHGQPPLCVSELRRSLPDIRAEQCVGLHPKASTTLPSCRRRPPTVSPSQGQPTPCSSTRW